MEISDYDITLKVAGGIILFLLGIIGFFIRKEFSNQNKKWTSQFAQIEKMINTISVTVDNLKSVVDIMRTEQGERDPITNKRLDIHQNHIENHEKRITTIEAQHEKNNH